MKQQLNRPDGFDYAALFGLAAGALVGGYILLGCKPAKTAAEAEDAAEQVACVDTAATRDEAVACQNAARARWAAKDGGAQ